MANPNSAKQKENKACPNSHSNPRPNLPKALAKFPLKLYHMPGTCTQKYKSNNTLTLWLELWLPLNIHTSLPKHLGYATCHFTTDLFVSYFTTSTLKAHIARTLSPKIKIQELPRIKFTLGPFFPHHKPFVIYLITKLNIQNNNNNIQIIRAVFHPNPDSRPNTFRPKNWGVTF